MDNDIVTTENRTNATLQKETKRRKDTYGHKPTT